MIRIAIVEDHPIVRRGLQTFLNAQDGLTVVAEAETSAEVVAALRSVEIDVIVLDLGLGQDTGVEVLGAVKSRSAHIPVIVFSGLAREQHAPTLLRLGATAYIEKGGQPEELVEAIRALDRGPSAPTGPNGGSDEDCIPAALHDQLTSREYQVFLRLARGEAISEVARHLLLTTESVSTYRRRVLRKLGLRTTSDLTHYAVNQGWI